MLCYGQLILHVVLDGQLIPATRTLGSHDAIVA